MKSSNRGSRPSPEADHGRGPAEEKTAGLSGAAIALIVIGGVAAMMLNLYFMQAA